MAFKPKTAGLRLGKAVPGAKTMPQAAGKSPTMSARPGGTGNRLGPVKSYAKGKG